MAQDPTLTKVGWAAPPAFNNAPSLLSEAATKGAQAADAMHTTIFYGGGQVSYWELDVGRCLAGWVEGKLPPAAAQTEANACQHWPSSSPTFLDVCSA